MGCGTLNERGGNFFGIFIAGIVFGNNNKIGIFGENFATNFPSRWITATSAAMDRDNLAFVAFDRSKNFF